MCGTCVSDMSAVRSSVLTSTSSQLTSFLSYFISQLIRLERLIIIEGAWDVVENLLVEISHLQVLMMNNE